MLLFLDSIGGGEILMVLLFVLIFFGAKSIPGIARSLGRFIRQVKDASQGIQDEISHSTADIKREMNANKALKDIKSTIENPAKEIRRNLETSGRDIKENIQKFDHPLHTKENSKAIDYTPEEELESSTEKKD